jgi:hypothetical protein
MPPDDQEMNARFVREIDVAAAVIWSRVSKK